MEDRIKSIYFRVLVVSSKFAKAAINTDFDFERIQALNPTADELADICTSFSAFIIDNLALKKVKDECGFENLSINVKQIVLTFKKIAKSIVDKDQEGLSNHLDELEKLSGACKY